MSADYHNMIGTIPPGFLAPADGNYASHVAEGGSPAAVSGASEIGEDDEEKDLEADASVVGARHIVPVTGLLTSAQTTSGSKTLSRSWSTQAEVHRAKLKAAYPHAANKIEAAPSQGPENARSSFRARQNDR